MALSGILRSRTSSGRDSLSFIAGTFYHAINNYVIMSIAFFVFAEVSSPTQGSRTASCAFLRTRGPRPGRHAGRRHRRNTHHEFPHGIFRACISALIPLLVPRLEKYGYQRRYTTALLCSSVFWAI
jgi:hypothetical protein